MTKLVCKGLGWIGFLMLVSAACGPTPAPSPTLVAVTPPPQRTRPPATLSPSPAASLTPLPVVPSPSQTALPHPTTPRPTRAASQTSSPTSGSQSTPTSLPSVIAITAEPDGKVFWDEVLLVDMAQEAPDCEAKEISFSPSREHFLVVLECFAEDLNEAYLRAYRFQADGGGERVINDAGERLSSYFWAPNGNWLFYGYFVTPEARAAGAWWEKTVLYNVYTGAKVTLPHSDIEGWCQREVSYSPTFLYFALNYECVGFSGFIYVFRADGSAEKTVRDSGGENSSAHEFYGWSPDGQWLMYAEDHGTQTLVLYHNQTTQKIFFDFEATLTPHWSPDGRWLAFNSPYDPCSFAYMPLLHLFRTDGNLHWLIDADFPPGVALRWEQPTAADAAVLYVGENAYRMSAGLEAPVPLQTLPPKTYHITVGDAVTPGDATKNLAVRAGPGTSFGVIDQLADQSQVQIIGAGRCLLDEAWFPIRYSQAGTEATGWLSGEALQP